MATNLVAGDTNGQTDVFIHDWLHQVTKRVSVSTGGAEVSGSSSNDYGCPPYLSQEGYYFAFSSGQDVTLL
jgi:hypothetical protein